MVHNSYFYSYFYKLVKFITIDLQCINWAIFTAYLKYFYFPLIFSFSRILFNIKEFEQTDLKTVLLNFSKKSKKTKTKKKTFILFFWFWFLHSLRKCLYLKFFSTLNAFHIIFNIGLITAYVSKYFEICKTLINYCKTPKK